MKRWIHAATSGPNPLSVIYDYLLETNKSFSDASAKSKLYKVAVTKKGFDNNSNPYKLSPGLAYTEREVDAQQQASDRWEEARQDYLDAVDSMTGNFDQMWSELEATI